MLQHGDSLAHYLIEGVLGTGGMGTVYLARDLHLDRTVALKVIGAQKAANRINRARFAQEARALARLSDPHVVQIFDFAPDHEPPYLVMEHVDGRSLRQVILDDGRQPLARVIDAALQCLEGLSVAHRNGLVHRDIKPSNILLADNGSYKLVDFGLARALLDEDLSLTGTDCVVGTPSYLAPECARGEEASARSDLYSLGMTLYHMAAGAKPWEGLNALDVISRISREPVPSLTTRLEAVPEELADWFDRLMAFEPEDRFPNAESAHRELDQIADAVLDAVPGSRLGGSSIRRSESNDVTMATAVEITTHRPTADTSSHLPVAQQDTSASHYTKPRTFGFYLKLLSAIWLISSLGTFVAIAIISEHAFQEQMASLKQTMRTTVHAISMTIDGEVHQRIAASEDMQSRTYLEMLDHLQQFQRINPDIQRIYTMAPTEKTATHGILAYVCDPYLEFDVNGNGFIDPEEERKAIGDELRAREHDPRLLLGLEQVTTAADIVHNQWGAVLSAYAPIRNELGKSVGVLVIDISGHKIVAMLTDNRQRAWFVLGISLLAFLAAAGLVAQRLNRPIAELKRGILSAANGTYDTKVAINGRNEFRDLADCINRMLALLRERDILRRAFEHYVAREMHEQISGQQKSASDSDERNRQVQLFCAVQRSRSKPIPENLEHDLANLISLVFDFGGVASQQMDGGILVTFNTIRADLNIEEQAIRAALAIQQCASQQDMEHVHLYIGIHRGRDRRTLTAIARAGRQLAADILISDDTFHPARLMFYADRYSDVKLDTGRTMSLFAIKGAVSG